MMWDASRGKNRTGLMRKLKRIFRKETLYLLFTYLLLIGIAFVFIYPFLFMITTSLKSNADLYDSTVHWIPRNFTFDNYRVAAIFMDYLTYFKNSVFLTLITTVAQVISCSMVGYGFARYRFPLKKALFAFVVICIIVPTQSIIIPLYMTYTSLGWVNTYLPMIIPSFFGFGLKGALYIFIFRQFYLQLPPDLENAARIDGCGFLRVYLRIVLPIARSAFLVVIVLSIVWHWNDFYEPSIFLDEQKLMMLPNALYLLIDYAQSPPPTSAFGGMMSDVVVNSAVVMAGTFMVVFPILFLYFFIQRQFIQGIERTGIVE